MTAGLIEEGADAKLTDEVSPHMKTSIIHMRHTFLTRRAGGVISTEPRRSR